MPGIVTTTATGAQDTDALFIGRQWATGQLTYSFPTDPAYYGTFYGSGEPGQGFLPLNAQQQAMAREILGLDAGIANLNFTELAETATQHGDLRFAMTSATPSPARDAQATTRPLSASAARRAASLDAK